MTIQDMILRTSKQLIFIFYTGLNSINFNILFNTPSEIHFRLLFSKKHITANHSSR